MSSASQSLTVLLLLVLAAVAASAAEQERDWVPRVPGQAFNASVSYYAGYITVSEERGAVLFYWFFEAAHDPTSKPLVL